MRKKDMIFSEQLTSQRIKKRRLELGYTQQHLASLCGITGPSTIFNYENGKCKFDIETLCKLSKALECDPDYLIGYINSPYSKEEEGEVIKNLTEMAVDTIKKANSSDEEILDLNYCIENYQRIIKLIDICAEIVIDNEILARPK